MPGEAATGDSFGSALATGDFDGDDCADLAVGVSEKDRSGRANDGDGVVQLFHGSPDGLRPGKVIDAGDLGRKRGAGRFGAALAAGDLDGDGRGRARDRRTRAATEARSASTASRGASRT